MKTSFLERFYPTIGTQDWPKKIVSFIQEDDKNLSATWSRFKRMVRACPHHEYMENHLTTFFYNSLNDFTKALLDSVVGGKLSNTRSIKSKQRLKKLQRITLGHEQGVEDYLGA